MSDKKRLLHDLRVIDLRAELERRHLDKSGVRGVLIQRLSKYMVADGQDPDTYLINVVDTPTKRTKHLCTAVEAPSVVNLPMRDNIVFEDAGENEDLHYDKLIIVSDEELEEDIIVVEESEKANRKRESEDDFEATEAKKPCLDDEDIKNDNTIDADDSINLDIEDDELLNEETDNTAKLTTDDAANEDEAEATGTETARGDEAASAADDQLVNDEAPATSDNLEKADKENEEDKDKDGDAAKKDKTEDGREGGPRNLWVSGLSGDTRATDLKQLCSKHGKVIGAKVVTNARTPGSRCYGYVTMASSHDAENCIKNLHKTELHGRMISVEKAKSDSESSRRHTSRFERRSSRDRRDSEEDERRHNNYSETFGQYSRRSTSRSHTSKDKSRRNSRSRERRRSPRDILSFSKIWKEHERFRGAREGERWRRVAEEKLRERERRQRQEKHRLELEREKLRLEREKIERENNELLRLQRERFMLEREKLELERLELKRAQLRLDEERRKRGYEYRKPAGSPPPLPEPAYELDQRHKRAPPPAASTSRGQFEAPPPPRFDTGANYGKRDRDREYRRDYPRLPGILKYPSNGTSNNDTRQPMPASTRVKEPGRSYESRDSRPHRPPTPGRPEPRYWNPSSRYTDTGPTTKGNSGGGREAWAGDGPRYGGSGGGGGGAYGQRYAPSYQAPPPGAAYQDRYAPQRDYRKY